MVTPLTLTILSAAVSKERRGVALGAWGGIGGLAVAVGPIVGGAIVQGISWHWIFWVNVPIGLALAPLARIRLGRDARRRRSSRPRWTGRSPAPASSRSSGASFAPTSRAGRARRSSGPSPSASRSWWGSSSYELRSSAPMLPIRYFRNRTFSGANAASLFMFFGMFGSVFLLAQFFQTVQGFRRCPPACASFRGRRCRSSSRRPPAHCRIGSTAARSWRSDSRCRASGCSGSATSSPRPSPYSAFILPFILSGVGMGMFFAPVANVVLSSVSAA